MYLEEWEQIVGRIASRVWFGKLIWKQMRKVTEWDNNAIKYEQKKGK